MPSLLQLAGAQTNKQTRFTPIYTGRWSSGIWTNRSPLRDANTTRISEKFYGASGDALISGLNVEITNRLTLARRPGNVVFDNNVWDSINAFYEFHSFHGNPLSILTEHVHVMVDEPNDLYSLVEGEYRDLIWTKSAGAGQTYMQGVGNTLYFANGVDNKKWLHATYRWGPPPKIGVWTTASTPLYSTFIEDRNGNLQQLTTQGNSAPFEPTWSTVVPDIGNNFAGGITTDGSARWTNRGPRVENWGIVGPSKPLSTSIAGGGVAWQANTVYSQVGVVIDVNGNLQKITTAGKSGATTPTWATIVGNTTTDGSITWTMLQTAASLVWQPHTVYAIGSYIIGNGCLFQSQSEGVSIDGATVTTYLWPSLLNNGEFDRFYPLSIGTASASATNNSFEFYNSAPSGGAGTPIIWNTLNGAGETTATTTPFPSYHNNYDLVIVGSINVPTAGIWECQLNSHHDGALLGIGGGAIKVSGPLNDPLHHSFSAVNSYPLMGGSNVANPGATTSDVFQVNYPVAGIYPIEIDFAYHSHNPAPRVRFLFQGNIVAPAPLESGTTQPAWPEWTLANAPEYPAIIETMAAQWAWINFGPIADFQWIAGARWAGPRRCRPLAGAAPRR